MGKKAIVFFALAFALALPALAQETGGGAPAGAGGVKWGVIGGVALGIVFPPSILAGAIGAGALGAAAGKVRNVSHRSALATELEGVMKPNTSGVIALVEDTAVVEIERALAKADEIVTEAVDRQVALEIDREAAQAKAAMGV